MYKVDLHCHTRASDGTYSPGEVIGMCKQRGVTHIAITDHDTTAGVAEAARWGRNFAVEVVPAIEISAYDYEHRRKAHILGFYIQPGHPALSALCDPLLAARHEASRRAVERLESRGFPITWEEAVRQARGSTAVYKQHIMHVLMDKGCTDSLTGDLYRTLFGKEGLASFPLDYIDVKEAIEAVRLAGGVPVLAHPGQQNNFDEVPRWTEWGLLGIEVSHPSHSETDLRRARELADRLALIPTGGTDFHGSYGLPHAIGSFGADEEVVHRLREQASPANLDFE